MVRSSLFIMTLCQVFSLTTLWSGWVIRPRTNSVPGWMIRVRWSHLVTWTSLVV